MKRTFVISLSFLLILGFVISVSPTLPADAVGEWYVYPGDSIQDAIDAAIAAGGGTIHFVPGVYNDTYIYIGPPEYYGLPSTHNIEKLELVGCGATLNDLYDWLLGEPVSGTVLEAAIHIDGANYPVTVQGFGLFNWYADYHPGQPWFDRAITVEYSDPTISDCVISHNITVGYGGGMCNTLSSPIVTNTVFIFCEAGEEGSVAYGGAIANWYSSPTITNSMFLYNFAQGGGKVYAACGGAIFNYDSSPTLINCVFYDNQVDNANEPVYGDAIYNGGWGSNTTLMNIISWNHPGETIFYGDGFTVSYSDTEDYFPGDGNISSDPMFVYAPLIEDMTFDDIPLLDFHLEPDSPCIDAGDNLAVPDWVSTDIEGNPRILNGIVDMGAYEFEQQLITAIIDIDPNTLNLKSKGKWMTAHIGLPEGYDVNDIDIFTVELHCNGSSVEAAWGDVQGSILMVKFNRQTVNGLLSQTGDVELKITGLVDEIPFEGFDTIRVINKGKK